MMASWILQFLVQRIVVLKHNNLIFFAVTVHLVLTTATMSGKIW